jgi:hypothetical protein
MADENKKKPLTMDEKIDELCAAIDKIAAAMAMLPALQGDLQMMHNDLQKINSDTQDLTIKMEVMSGIKSASTISDPMLVQASAIPPCWFPSGIGCSHSGDSTSSHCSISSNPICGEDSHTNNGFATPTPGDNGGHFGSSVDSKI